MVRMTDAEFFEVVLLEAREKYFPKLKVVEKKDSLLMRFVNSLMNLTGQKDNAFLKSFWTTLYFLLHTIYVTNRNHRFGLKTSIFSLTKFCGNLGRNGKAGNFVTLPSDSCRLPKRTQRDLTLRNDFFFLTISPH